jgi:putative ATP-dependent endonuclease of OLD family
VIKRLVERNQTEDEIQQIMRDANSALLKRPEVSATKNSINLHLDNILKHADRSQIGLNIEQSKIEYIVNVIKPYLPHDWTNNSMEGFQLWQNSLGFNNLIYIATVLGDIKERISDDPIPHFAMLIEEPEAHIHPQLQLSLYNFLKTANESDSSQLFITTHSPTLTSKVPLENLILLEGSAYCIADTFLDRQEENLIQDTRTGKVLDSSEITTKKLQLQRYLDVTKCQLFYAKSCLLVEGISEELLVSALAKARGFALEDYRIELINVDGISFYPFMFMFNSQDSKKRLPKKIAILSDDDRHPDAAKRYALDELIADDYQQLDMLETLLESKAPANRIANIRSISNGQPGILTSPAYQTMELDLCISNVKESVEKLEENLIFRYLGKINTGDVDKVKTYAKTLSVPFSQADRRKIGIMLWKCLPGKAAFAQDFSAYLIENIDAAGEHFTVPPYIAKAFDHLTR